MDDLDSIAGVIRENLPVVVPERADEVAARLDVALAEESSVAGSERFSGRSPRSTTG
ncbi:hypothetical protein [Nonomuraea sp. JJY05]|jgi:hypothetical protein|uniref:hypothetical protein n=1 Tax=Nonomuraea sp. JJY05 TaxID=3350255 RepID=UPI00373E64A5